MKYRTGQPSTCPTPVCRTSLRAGAPLPTNGRVRELNGREKCLYFHSVTIIFTFNVVARLSELTRAELRVGLAKRTTSTPATKLPLLGDIVINVTKSASSRSVVNPQH